MAKRGRVRLRGRFSPGTIVQLMKVQDPGTISPYGGEEVAVGVVDKHGEVSFDAEDGARYFVTGYQGGFPLEVRVRGNADPDAVLGFQAPVQPSRVRLSDGTWADEKPPQRDLPPFESAPHLAQEQTGDEIPQRSSTWRGTAHPVDPEEQVPYGRQEDVDDDVPQMSDTPTGRAAPVDVGFASQEDVPAGTWQRSDTPLGVATPLPRGGPVEAQRMKESAEAKERRGEPGKAAAAPLTGQTDPHGRPRKKAVARTAVSKLPGEGEASAQPAGETQPSLTTTEDDARGRDASGQPLADDVATASGTEPAKKPAEG